MKKKLLAICVVAILVITAIAGTTIAYLQDTDSEVNTFTVGNVQIVQNEKDRNDNDFVDQKLWPIINDSKDENGYHMGGNYVDKIVTVTNTGTEAAYIRTHIAIPEALDTLDNASLNVLHWNGASASDTNGAATSNGAADNDWYWGKSVDVEWPGNTTDWNHYYTKVNGVDYIVYVVTHKSAVAAGHTTAPSLLGVYLDKDVNYDPEGGYFLDRATDVKINFDLSGNIDVLVFSEAVQAQGWGDDVNVAWTALDQAFGEVGSYNPWEN